MSKPSEDSAASRQEKDHAVAPRSTTPRSTAEQVSFLIALLILFGIIGSVGYLWVRDRNQSPPTLQVLTDSAEQRETSYYVPFTVTNIGGTTAETVQVIAELRVNNEIVEWGEQSIDFLSREEAVTGAFVFLRDPSEGELTVRVASYLIP